MKLFRANDINAPEQATWELPVDSMSVEECRTLLRCIAQRANPGEINAKGMFWELTVAEASYKERLAVS